MANVMVLLHIFVDSAKLEKACESLRKLPQVVDVYEVTGEYDVVVIIESNDIADFREFLKNNVLKIDGIKSTVSSVVLHIHKKDGRLLD